MARESGGDFGAGRFVIIPFEVACDRRLTGRQRLILITLCSFRGKGTDLVWPRRREIANRWGIHPVNVSKTTTELVDLGWLKKTGTGGNRRSTRYTICPPPRLVEVAETTTLPVAETTTVAKTANPPVVETTTPPVAETTTPIRRVKRKSKEEEYQPPNPLEFEGWWKDWLKAIRITSPERTNAGTKATAEENFSKLRKAGWSVETIRDVTGKYLRATLGQRKNAEGFLNPKNKLVSQYFTQEVDETPTPTGKKATWDEVVPTAALEVVPETIIEAEYDSQDIERLARSIG